MKKTGKVFGAVCLLLATTLTFLAVSCSGNADSNGKGDKTPELVSCGIEHELEFGGVYIKNTIDEFNSLGFIYGDSVNVTFSNGYKMTDIPYYNGYYTKTGEPLLIAYPGYDYIKAAINNGDDLWKIIDGTVSSNLLQSSANSLWRIANLDSDITATITLNERGKYLDIQDARDIHYLDDRTLYPSDAVFGNFRALTGGRLKENYIYRSASPCDNQHKRAAIVNALIKKAGVRFVLDLADTAEKIDGYIAKEDFNSAYLKELYEDGKVLPLALNMNFGSDYFKGQTILALKAIIDSEGPFLIHCTEGKDRTGFLCLLVEALAGATYGEIVEDYMITYFNYYAITKAFDAKRYTTIVENVLNPMIEVITGEGVALTKDTVIENYATEYIKLGGAMTDGEVVALKTAICKGE